jgi:nitrite reductase (NADH) small subunit
MEALLSAGAVSRVRSAFPRNVMVRPLVTDYVDVGAVADIPAGRPAMRIVGDRKIALCRTASGIHALDNTCPHRGGPLSEGDLIGEELVCPWHLWSFDVKTGDCPGSTSVGVAAHDVKIEGDRILVKLNPSRSMPELL